MYILKHNEVQTYHKFSWGNKKAIIFTIPSSRIKKDKLFKTLSNH